MLCSKPLAMRWVRSQVLQAWCAAQVAVTAGSAAAYDPATGEVNLAGTPIPNAIFDRSAAAGELVKLRLQ